MEAAGFGRRGGVDKSLKEIFFENFSFSFFHASCVVHVHGFSLYFSCCCFCSFQFKHEAEGKIKTTHMLSFFFSSDVCLNVHKQKREKKRQAGRQAKKWTSIPEKYHKKILLFFLFHYFSAWLACWDEFDKFVKKKSSAVELNCGIFRVTFMMRGNVIVGRKKKKRMKWRNIILDWCECDLSTWQFDRLVV